MDVKIFIAGPRAIPNLNKSVEEKLYGIYEKDHVVLVGDADGIDKAVQGFFSAVNYGNVIVYASNGKARNNLGKWPVEAIRVSGQTKGFDFYAAKDEAMANSADYGFMIWNGESKGTLNNIVNLLNGKKNVLVFFSPHNTFVSLDSFDKLDILLLSCSAKAKAFTEKLRRNPTNAQKQMALFDN